MDAKLIEPNDVTSAIAGQVVGEPIEADRIIEFSKDGKYLFVFDEPLSEAEVERIKHVLTEWIKSDKPIAVVSGFKFRISEKPETVGEQPHD